MFEIFTNVVMPLVTKVHNLTVTATYIDDLVNTDTLLLHGI